MCKFSYAHVSRFYSFDLDLDPMTLIYELDLDILKVQLHPKTEASRSKLSKVIARTGQTYRQTRPNALQQPHSRVLKIGTRAGSKAAVACCEVDQYARSRSEWLSVNDAVSVAVAERMSVERDGVLASDRAIVVIAQWLDVGCHSDRSGQLRMSLVHAGHTVQPGRTSHYTITYNNNTRLCHVRQ